MHTLGMAGAAQTLALFQDTTGDMHSLVTWVMVSAIATAVIALMLVVAAIVAIGAQKAAMKEIAETKAAAMAEIAEIKGKVMPLIGEAHSLMTDLTPEVKAISAKVGVLATNLESITSTLKTKLKEFEPTIDAAKVTLDEANETVRAANQKTQQQVQRVNGMVTGFLDTTAQMGKAVHHTITQPVREVSGIVGGIKAAVTTLFNGAPKRREPVYKSPVGTYEPADVYGEGERSTTAYPAPKPNLEP